MSRAYKWPKQPACERDLDDAYLTIALTSTGQQGDYPGDGPVGRGASSYDQWVYQLFVSDVAIPMP